jgi:hypothetical protein
MRANDLILFCDDDSWSEEVAGEIGLVVEVRQYCTSGTRTEEELVCIINGKKTSIFTSGLGIMNLSSEEV